MATIVVTGGCGYIGSHTLVDLIDNGFDVISIDNLSRSSEQILEGVAAITGVRVKNHAIDLCDFEKTYQFFQQHNDIQGVIHFAAFKTVPESVKHPLMYYRNNLTSLINILECIRDFKIPCFVFSSSCSVYGNVEKLPVTEDTPLNEAQSPYARTKQIGEKIIEDFSKAYPDIQSILLRYFNPVGAHPTGLIGESPVGPPENLAPIITQTAIGKREKLYVHGGDYPTRDGTCIRDYIHVMDIAHAHTLALKYLMAGKNRSNCEVFNLGTGRGVSVLEAINAFEKVTGVKLNYEIGPRRAGDVVAIYADNTRAKKHLGWEPRYSIEDMMHSAWLWEQRLSKMAVNPEK